VKSPGLAAVLSFFWPGLGQIYNGQIAKGLFFMVLALLFGWLMFVVIGFILYPILWVYGIYDAYKTAERINAERGAVSTF
jgi:TM2 domain-containing membrane protein YozV